MTMAPFLSPKQPYQKSVAGAAAFLVQNYFSLETEINLSNLPLCHTLFSRIRDVMESESLKILYFPIPKSACTVFATLLALHDKNASDYDSSLEGIHKYRFRTGNLTIKSMKSLRNNNYFKFTVIRDPYTRLVSAYLDKIVKPHLLTTSDNQPIKNPTTLFPANLTFEKLIEFLAATPDHAIEKHWRPQYTFFRNVRLDYIGCFERIDHAFEVINNKFNINMHENVVPRVHTAKRTHYSKDSTKKNSSYLGATEPHIIASYRGLPKAESFYNENLKNLVKKRYAKDIEIHQASLSKIDQKRQ